MAVGAASGRPQNAENLSAGSEAFCYTSSSIEMLKKLENILSSISVTKR